MIATRLIVAGLIIVLIGLWLFQTLWSERVYNWSRQPDEFWFSGAAMAFALLAGVAMLVWGLWHMLPSTLGR